jgi:uncharacterized protein
MPWLLAGSDHVRIRVVIVPRASRTQIVGVHDDRLKIQLTAPPVDGKANKALIHFLSKHLNLKRDSFTIATGETGRRKTINIAGVDKDFVRSKLI